MVHHGTADDVLLGAIPELKNLTRSEKENFLYKQYTYRDDSGNIRATFESRGLRLKLYNEDGELHGICRGWWWAEEGIRRPTRSIDPYYRGKRHGVSKSWNQEGELVGLSTFKNGNGVLKNYFDSGQLREEIPFKDGRKYGRSVILHENGQISHIQWYHEGIEVRSASFSPNGEVVYASWYNFTGSGILFSPDGFSWFINHNEVTAKAYKDARKLDSTIPRFIASAEEAIKIVRADADISELIVYYKKLEPVVIPLKEMAPIRH